MPYTTGCTCLQGISQVARQAFKGSEVIVQVGSFLGLYQRQTSNLQTC